MEPVGIGLCILITAALLPTGASWQGNLTSSASGLLLFLGKQLNLSQLCLPSKNENFG